MIHHGDCLDVMATLEPESVSAIVTDPPYGLEFMGKAWDRLGDVGKTSHAGPSERDASTVFGRQRVAYSGSSNRKCGACRKWEWDYPDRKCVCERPDFPNVRAHQSRIMQDWHLNWAEAAFRVAKPGAHLLAFGGTRTVHRLTSAIEDAGWEIRDCLVWGYASGFPKSHNLSGEWDGWGTALKPAWEPIVMARKPLRGTVAVNVAAHGTGALNIDGTRITMAAEDAAAMMASMSGARNFRRVDAGTVTGLPTEPDGGYVLPSGRWPANVILTDPIFDGGIEGVVGGGETQVSAPASGPTWTGPSGSPSRNPMPGNGDRDPAFYGDSGTYSRFFLIPKADRAEREPVHGHDLTAAKWTDGRLQEDKDYPSLRGARARARANVHPTVKPVDLMRHLVRLVTPPGGLVLDPFLGSGTTAIACEMEGFDWIGIEREAEYVAIAEARLVGVQRGFGLSA